MTAQPLDTTITLHEAAHELDVHYMTVYRYVRLGILPATKVGRSWRIERADLDAFASQAPEETPRGETDWDERFVRRILAADEPGAWGVLEAAQAAGMSFGDTYTEIIIPSLHRIGDLWQAGEIDVAGEHIASQIVTRIVGRLGPKITSRGVRRGTVVLGSTATEDHRLPISIAADLFRAARFEVVDLGANLPYQSFGRAVAMIPNVIAAGIGVTIPGQDNELTKTIAFDWSFTTRKRCSMYSGLI